MPPEFYQVILRDRNGQEVPLGFHVNCEKEYLESLQGHDKSSLARGDEATGATLRELMYKAFCTKDAKTE